jgi:hypothetical protein
MRRGPDHWSTHPPRTNLWGGPTGAAPFYEQEQDMSDYETLLRQYDSPPAPGMRRFWMSVVTWAEDWENVEFFVFETGGGLDYRLRPSVKGSPAAEDLDEDEFERLYVGDASVCMLVDAPDETAAWAKVRKMFPDGIERFVNPADEKTLTSIGRGGRFLYPAPEPADDAEIQDSGATAP